MVLAYRNTNNKLIDEDVNHVYEYSLSAVQPQKVGGNLFGKKFEKSS